MKTSKRNFVSVSELTETPWIDIDTSKGIEQLRLSDDFNGKVMVRVLVTPEIAQWFLDSMVKNRAASSKMISKFSHDLENGEWHPNAGNANICCVKSGRFSDGQHRMRMIILTGIPTVMYLELNTDSMDVVDTGASRNTKNSLDVAGCDEFFLGHHGGEAYHYVARNILNVVNATNFWKSAPVTDGVRDTADITNATYKNFITENHESIIEAMDKCGAVLYSPESVEQSYQYFARNTEKQIVAYAWYLHNVCGYEYDTINEFFSQLMSADRFRCRNKIINVVRTMFVKNITDVTKKSTARYFSVSYCDYLIRKCWNAWVMNDPDRVKDLLPFGIFDTTVAGISKGTVKKIKFEQFIGNPQVSAMNV